VEEERENQLKNGRFQPFPSFSVFVTIMEGAFPAFIGHSRHQLIDKLERNGLLALSLKFLRFLPF
jgi:hypothetical protein